MGELIDVNTCYPLSAICLGNELCSRFLLQVVHKRQANQGSKSWKRFPQFYGSCLICWPGRTCKLYRAVELNLGECTATDRE